MEEKTTEKIRQYWENRAREYVPSGAATTDDIYLRELEILTIIQTLHEINMLSGTVLDVGCGDGYSMLAVAKALPNLSFLGVDYSEGMINLARKRLCDFHQLKARVSFIVGDVTDLGQICGDSSYDVVLSDRCLINLESAPIQAHAIHEIAKHTKEGGYYIAIENFIEGHENMNRARYSVGLREIPVRWHNLYFNEKEFIQTVQNFFNILEFKDFSSSYYFATRVIYSKMCQMKGENPDYQHEIHQLAIHLPWFGQFSPIRMVVIQKNQTRNGMKGNG
jgi:ubiquinone/menaquinone biosynthesis C-methylase UbiE